MGFKKNVAVTGFPLGKFFFTSTGAEVTTGTPTGAYYADGSSGALTGSASYDATAKLWVWSEVQQSAMNGDEVGLTFDLTGCYGVSHTIRTEAVYPDVNAAQLGGTAQTGRDLGADGSTLTSRLTATRAGYLDQLEHVADHLDTLIGDAQTLLSRLSAARAGYLDNVNNASLQTLSAATVAAAVLADPTYPIVTDTDGGVLVAGLNPATEAQVQSAAAAAIASKLPAYATEIAAAGTTAKTLDDVTVSVDLEALVAAVLAGVVEGTVDVAGALRLLLSALAGDMVPGEGGAFAFRDLANTKDRLTGYADDTGRTMTARDGA